MGETGGLPPPYSPLHVPLRFLSATGSAVWPRQGQLGEFHFMNLVLLAIACGVIALLYGILTSQQVLRASPGNQRMVEVAAAIQEGARAYLRRQYTTIAIVGVIVAIVIYAFLGRLSAGGFGLGPGVSGAAGFNGMNISGRANVRRTEAARTSLQNGLTVAFRAGAVTGLLVAGLALLAIAAVFTVLTDVLGYAPNARVVG